ncbi:MAG: hypothetical protein FJ213_02785 [Ignavibacteria bacterium]|nr:hypothetical protein [Ignavibacteria bacterium]
MQSEQLNIKNLVEEACEILNTKYSVEEDVYLIEVTTEEDNSVEVSIYQSIDSFDVEKIDCTVTIGPIVKNLDLLYTFLKNNFELDYGSFAIINEDGVDLLIMVDSLLLESCSAEDLASVVLYMAEVSHDTEALLMKYS